MAIKHEVDGELAVFVRKPCADSSFRISGSGACDTQFWWGRFLGEKF